MAVSQYSKFSRNKILNSLPTKSFGSDGDIVLSKIGGKGVYLCSKVNGIWYAANKLEELRKIEKSSISELVTKKISVRGLIDASKDTDKFIVSDAGQLKYRTGDEVIGDLNIPVSDIDYQTAYCSLGQYTDKESCKSNGGTWYYSENDSHDSISSTAENELLTVGSSLGKLDAEPTLIYDGSQLEIKYNSDFDDNWQTSAQTSLLKLSYDSTNYCSFSTSANGETTIETVDSDGAAGNLTFDADGRINIDSNGRTMLKASGTEFGEIGTDTGFSHLKLYENAGASSNDYFQLKCLANGATTMLTVDAGGATGHITLVPNGDLVLDPTTGKTIINATDGLYLDGGGDTYITESGADAVQLFVGGDIMMQLTENGADGNTLLFRQETSVGFTRAQATFSATGVIASGGTDDTDIDFRFSNKFRLEMTGDITTINLIFPSVSGNFLLVCTTNGDHDVTNWKAWEYDESAATTTDVMWAGGSVPAFTSSGVDIVSFYWDADEQQAYGVASLAFATP